MRSKKQRDFNIFSLSFLDVISCGFGAVVLLVLVSNTDDAPLSELEADATALLNRVQSVEEQNSALSAELAQAREAAESKVLLLQRLQGMSAAAAGALEEARGELDSLKADVSGLTTVQGSLERLRTAAISVPERPTVRDEEVGGIPVESEYVIFIVDTSGSMQEIWDRVTRELENIIRIHPRIKGFQILNDNGTHLVSGYQGRWIPDTPARRESVIKLFNSWKSASNSSPVEGLEVALKRYVTPSDKVSIYIFGDEYSGSSYDPVINALLALNTNRITGDRFARVHAVGFLSRFTTGGFATLMREITRRNNGTFIALPK